MSLPAAPTSTRWELWSSYAFLATDDPRLLAAAQAVARRVLAEVDRTCSRFRDDSDLSRANARPGRWVDVDPLLVAATRVALEAARVTAGLVDPCLGRRLIALGYDADLAVLRARGPRDVPTVRRTRVPREAWRDVRVDDEAVRVPRGAALDLGATAKAWAADLVAASVVDELGCRVVVSLGGDLRIAGPDGTTGGPWPVEVTERPGGDAPETVLLDRGGIATSTTLERRWTTTAGEMHHLLDPRTGRPTTGPWRTVTATGPTCVAANTATTAALVLGAAAVPWLEQHDVTARLVHESGAVHRVGSWPTASGRN